MTREEYGKHPNFEGELQRIMEFDEEQNYQVGGVYSLGIHWSTPDISTEEFLQQKRYTYIFHCENLEGYQLDYDNLTEDDMFELDTNEDCFEECEVLVDPDKKFEILDISGGFYDDDENVYIADIIVKEVK